MMQVLETQERVLTSEDPGKAGQQAGSGRSVQRQNKNYRKQRSWECKS